MKNLPVIFFIFLVSCTWSHKDRVLLGTSCLATAADYATTLHVLHDGGHELNPVIGSHPSDLELAMWMALSQAGITYLAHCYPKWRSWLLGGSTIIHGGCAVHNVGVD